jgi:hypothetical protein
MIPDFKKLHLTNYETFNIHHSAAQGFWNYF